MQIIASKRYPGVITHVSEDIHLAHEALLTDDVLESSVQELLDYDYERIFESNIDETFFQFVELYGRRNGSSGILVLNAHGGTVDGTWKFQDGKRVRSVQNWINKHGKTCTAIVLLVCNAGGHDVRSRHALTFIPDTIVGSGILARYLHSFHYTLLLPSGEEIDNNTIDWHVAQLNK